MTYIAKQDEYKDVYTFNNEGEYTQTLENELIQIGTGLPANSTLIEVIPHKDKFARVFNEDAQKWEYVEDHRGEDVYSTINGSKIEIKEIGMLPENATIQPKPEGYYKWSGVTWVEDVEARNEATKQQNIAFLAYETRRVNDAITPLDDAIEFGVATDEEIVRHKELRKYRIELMRVKEQEGYPLNAVFPTCPDFFSE